MDAQQLGAASTANAADLPLSLCRLLDPEVLADPYPLYRALRERDPVYWDPYLHAWVVTSYAEVVAVLHRFSAECAPTPQQFIQMGLAFLEPIARVLVKQMLFMDGTAHARLAVSAPRHSRPTAWRRFARISRKSPIACSTMWSRKAAWT